MLTGLCQVCSVAEGATPMYRDEWVDAVSAVLSCDTAAAEALMGKMRCVSVGHRTVLSHQGDLLSQCWLVLDGAVRIQLSSWDGQRVQIAYHGPGELFGAFPKGRPSRADIWADGNVMALEISTSALSALAEEHAAIAYGLSCVFAKQLDMSLDRIAARVTLSAAGRVYSAILHLADDANRLDPAPTVTALAMSVNTSRETASRAIAALERRGIVKREGQVMTIISPRMLANMVV